MIAFEIPNLLRITHLGFHSVAKYRSIQRGTGRLCGLGTAITIRHLLSRKIA